MKVAGNILWRLEPEQLGFTQPSMRSHRRHNNRFDRSRRSEFRKVPSVLRGGPVNRGVRRSSQRAGVLLRLGLVNLRGILYSFSVHK